MEEIEALLRGHPSPFPPVEGVIPFRDEEKKKGSEEENERRRKRGRRRETSPVELADR